MVAAAVQTAFVAAKPVQARQQRGRVVRVAALQQQEAPAAPLRFLAAGLAAAAVATCSPAEAGVVLVQPEVKNFVKDTPAKASPAEKKAAAPKATKAQEEPSAPGSGFEAFRPLVLPLSLLVVGGAGAAAVKADPKFAALLDESWGAKDSNVVGVGYETAPGLKDTPFFGGSNTSGAAPKKAGTTKKAAGTTKKAAGTVKKSALSSVFGSRG
ncbi:hypothetical protein ABPG75_013829 [Micractinium tetrahymenae]